MELRGEKVTEEVGQTDGQLVLGPGLLAVFQASGTVVDTLASNVYSKKITSGGTNVCNIIVPLNNALVRSEASRGAKVTSVEVHYVIATQACTACTFKLWKAAIPADGTAWTAVEVASSKDIADASCYDADEHRVTITPTTPAFIAEDELWMAEVVLTPANGTVLDVLGATVNFGRAL